MQPIEMLNSPPENVPGTVPLVLAVIIILYMYMYVNDGGICSVSNAVWLVHLNQSW